MVAILWKHLLKFWATTKVKTVNGERQLQALVEKKKVVITETSIRSDLNLEDAGGTDCLPTDTIFEELRGWGLKKLEKARHTKIIRFKRLYRGRSIEDIDKDAEVSLVNETQGRSDDTKRFDTDALISDEVFAENDMTEKEHDDKGKARWVEPEVPLNKKDQIRIAESLWKARSEKKKQQGLQRAKIELQETSHFSKIKNGTMNKQDGC
ncbi:hypothetical protein Tco_0629687 [Tanacetum coccineum]|uniref:Uncharacterized protein n=1 Tax=Tanacetum coccineum TaxID=301880 RepID=A0ABQ4WU31_9ASTR